MPNIQFENGRLRFVTDPSRQAEDCQAFLDLLRRTMLDFAIEGDDVTIDSMMLRLPDVGINTTRASAFRTLRTRAMAKGTDHRALLILLDGRATISHLGGELALRAGTATLLSSAEASCTDRGNTRHIIIALPKASLALAAPNSDAALMTSMDATAEPFRLLRAYLGLLARNMPAQPDLQRLAASQVRDLVAAAIGSASTRDRGHGLRAARLRVIKDDIERNLAGDASAEALARRHGVSSRYIRKLFESEGTSLSRFVLARRLIAVHRMLGSRQHAHLPISSLAYEAGFGDLSTFNRAFRARFGATPSGIRALAGNQLI
jgi:AraC-like DNA-binding protein